MKGDGGPTRGAGAEFANGVFERAFEFTQRDAVLLGISEIVNESKRCSQNCSQVRSASRCHGGGLLWERFRGIISPLAPAENWH
jgi:hypothetical protein